VDTRPNWDIIGGMLADLKKSTGQIDEIHQESKKVRGVAWSDDGLIKATVGPRGQLLDLDLDPRLFRKPDSKALAAAIVATVRSATAEAMEKSKELMERAMPSDMKFGQIGGMDMTELWTTSDADLIEREEKSDG